MTIRVAKACEAPEIVRLINLAFAVEKFFVDGDRIDLAEVLAHFESG